MSRVLTEADAAADLAGLPRPVSSDDVKLMAAKLDDMIANPWSASAMLLVLVSERDALAGRVRELEGAQPETVPADCDVRKIMLDVVPGWDGEGVEVYAKSIADVEATLSDLGSRLEDWEMGIRRLASAPTATEPSDAERWNWLASDCDGNEQDDFIQWLAHNVASKADINARADAAIHATKGGKL